MQILLAIFYILGLIFIFYILAKICDRYFVSSLDIISHKLKLTEDVAGATLMAVGSSAPEFFTALIAILNNSEEVGAGTIVGSAIFNILVIIGASALVSAAVLNWRPVIRDISFYLLSIILLLLTFSDGEITLVESVTYVAVYIVYLVILFMWGKWFPKAQIADELEDIVEEVEEVEEEIGRSKNPLLKIVSTFDHLLSMTFPNLEKKPQLYLITFMISILYIIGLSWLLVDFAVNLSDILGIPAVIISLTVLAGGTSIPDLLSSMIVAKQGRGDMAVSNAVGSNVFDILICLGLPWLLFILYKGEKVVVGTENLTSSVLLLFFTMISLLILLLLQKFRIGKYSGLMLIGIYLLYLVYNVYLAIN